MSKNFVRSHLTVTLLTLLLAACQVASAQDQQRGERVRRGPGGFGGGPMGFGGPGGGPGAMEGILLRSDAVQKELQLSEEQQQKLDTISEESRTQMREAFGRGRDLSEEERTKLREDAEKARQAHHDKITAVLNEAQSKRLAEIALQIQGARAIVRDDVAAKLGLSDEQKQSVQDVFSAQRDMMRDLVGNIRDLEPEQRREKFEEMRKKGEELQAETNTAVMEVLTAEQRSKLDGMKGKPFEMDQAELFRGGFRGRRGEGGPGGAGGERGRGQGRGGNQ